MRKQNGMLLDMVWCWEQRFLIKEGRKDHSRVPHCTRSIISQLSRRLKPSVSLSRKKPVPPGVESSNLIISFSNHIALFILKAKSIYYTHSWLPSLRKNSALFTQFIFSHIFTEFLMGGPEARKVKIHSPCMGEKNQGAKRSTVDWLGTGL